MFDTRTEKFQEWPVPTPGSWPYDVTADKNGQVWTGGEYNDRILRLDPKSGGSPNTSCRARRTCGGCSSTIDDAGDVLGGQQSRRVDRQARAARPAVARRRARPATVFEGARLIVGDGTRSDRERRVHRPERPLHPDRHGKGRCGAGRRAADRPHRKDGDAGAGRCARPSWLPAAA